MAVRIEKGADLGKGRDKLADPVFRILVPEDVYVGIDRLDGGVAKQPAGIRQLPGLAAAVFGIRTDLDEAVLNKAAQRMGHCGFRDLKRPGERERGLSVLDPDEVVDDAEMRQGQTLGQTRLQSCAAELRDYPDFVEEREKQRSGFVIHS